jgi:hypothetical protein
MTWRASEAPFFFTPVIGRFVTAWEFGRKVGRWTQTSGQPGIGKTTAILYVLEANPPQVAEKRVPIIASFAGGDVQGHVAFVMELNAWFGYQPDSELRKVSRLIDNIIEFKTEQIMIDDHHALSRSRLKLLKHVTDFVYAKTRRKVSVALVGVTLDGLTLPSQLDSLTPEDREQFRKRLHPRYRSKIIHGFSPKELVTVLKGFEDSAARHGISLRLSRLAPTVHDLLMDPAFRSFGNAVTMQNVVDLLDEVVAALPEASSAISMHALQAARDVIRADTQLEPATTDLAVIEPPQPLPG